MPQIYKRDFSDVKAAIRDRGLYMPTWHDVRGLGFSPSVLAMLSKLRSSKDDGAESDDEGKETKKEQNPKSKGKEFTSQYRGVHQTATKKRWEAQFRRNGKPTSLGCFDEEIDAARAYDKMMLWCQIHRRSGHKTGQMNFDIAEYEDDLQWLQQVTQEDLVQALRSAGRKQSAARLRKKKTEKASDIPAEDPQPSFPATVVSPRKRPRKSAPMESI